MSAERLRPGERFYAREAIEKHGDDLAGPLAESLPLYGPGPFDILYWQPIHETKRRQTMIVPDKDRSATPDEIDDALGTGSGTYAQLPNPIRVYTRTATTRIGRWCQGRDNWNGFFLVVFCVLAALAIGIVGSTFTQTVAYADHTCRADGAWVQCEGVRLKADRIEGVTVVRDGSYNTRVLDIRYASGTETVRVGASHLDEALALLDRPKPK